MPNGRCRGTAGDGTLTVDLGRLVHMDRIGVSGNGGSGDAEIMVDERTVGTIRLGREWTTRIVGFTPVEGLHVGLRHLRTGAVPSAVTIWWLGCGPHSHRAHRKRHAHQ